MRLRWRHAVLAIAWLSINPLARAEDLPVVDRLRDKDANVRRSAANDLRVADRDQQRASLPALIDVLLREKDGQVRLAVFDAITALGPDAEPAIPALVQTLRTDYGGQRLEESHQDYRSALALASIGKPAVEPLRGLLKERKEGVRAEVVMGLGRIGPDAAGAVPDLIPLLGDASDRIRREASRSLGLIGRSAIEPLVAASADGKVVVREGAAEALGILPASDERVGRAVLELARDKAPEVRAAAIRALSKLNLPDDRLMPIVLENIRDDDEQVRLAVVRLVVEGRTLLPRIGPELESLLAADRDGVAAHAAYLLGKSGPEAAPRLIEALRREGSRIDPIAGALAQIGRAAVAPLVRAIEDPAPRVRRGAALALGQIRPLAPDTAGRLTRGLADPDPEVRAAFLAAIGGLGPRAAESVPAVRTLLRDGSPEIRGRAVEVLLHSASHDELLLGDLRPLLDDPEPRVERRAIDAIRDLGPIGREALPLVIGRLGSDDPDVRFAAAQMVEGHGPAGVSAISGLSRMLGDPAPKNRALAAATLGKFAKDAQAAFPGLAKLLEDDDPATREAAASAVGSLELDAETVRPALARALRDEKAEVRRAATRGVTRLGPQGAILIPDIIPMAARKENVRSVDRLLRPFERAGPDARSIPELLKLLDHDQVPVRLLAIKFLGLGGRNGGAALPALERLRDDPNAEVRQQAKLASDQIRKATAPEA